MRKEIEKECRFLEDWAFKFDSLKKSELNQTLKNEYEECHLTVVDAQNSLKGERMAWHTDNTLIIDLKRVKVSFQRLAKKGFFNSPAELKKQSDMIDSIIKMLSVTEVSNKNISMF
jgi:hypothetical protein